MGRRQFYRNSIENMRKKLYISQYYNICNIHIHIYLFQAIDLTPSDITNTADPYISINLGNKRISDQANYVSKQLNPIFGR